MNTNQQVRLLPAGDYWCGSRRDLARGEFLLAVMTRLRKQRYD
jgi:hypothetical protein